MIGQKCIIATFIVVVSCFDAFGQIDKPIRTRERIIRAERPIISLDNEDEKPAVQIVSILIANKVVDINRTFDASDDWLEKLQVRVKNIGIKEISCVGIAFGLLAEIDTKLQTHESWPWGVGLYKGKCGTGESSSGLRLRPGEETNLSYADTQAFFRKNLPAAKLAKAVLRAEGLVAFKKGKPIELTLRLPIGTYFPDDAPY